MRRRVLWGAVAAALLALVGGTWLWACPQTAETSVKDKTPDTGDTVDPIVLEDGTVKESAVDIVLPGVAGTWTHRRDYSSRLTGGVPIQGYGWTGGMLTAFLVSEYVDQTMTVQLYLNHVSKRVFTKDAQSWNFTPPPDFPATLTRYTETVEEDEYDYYKLQYTHTGETFYFKGFGENWHLGEKGLLCRSTDRYGTVEVTYGYDSENNGGRITSVTSTQDWGIVYTYVASQQNNEGKIAQIDVYDGDPAQNAHVVHRVKYTYYYANENYSTDLGVYGDLVMVTVLKRKSTDPLLTDPTDGQFSIKRVTMYRYHQGGDEADGAPHQLKAVFSPESVAKAMADGAKSELELLDVPDSGAVGANQMQDYANVTYTYYYGGGLDTDEVNAEGGSVGPMSGGGVEDLNTKYGCTDFDEWDGGPGYVKSQTIRKDYRGFLGTRTYFFMANTSEETAGPNDVTKVAVEDTTLTYAGGVRTGTRRIYGLNKDRQILRDIIIDDPKAQTPKYWCTSYVLGTTAGQDYNSVVEKRMPSAHTCINTDTEVATFLDANDEDEGEDWENTDIMNASAGLVYVYAYNSDGFLTEEAVKQGEAGDPVFLKVVEYGDGEGNRVTYLPWKTHVYHTATTTKADDSKRFTTTTTYTFHDDDKQQMKERTVSREAVPTTANGSNAAIETQEYFDDHGRLRWVQDGEGRVSYYAYHPDTGGLAYLMVDVETDDLPGDITNGSAGQWIAWSGDVPFAQTDSALKLVTKFGYDVLGRQTSTTDADGVLTCTVYLENETRVYPGWDTTAHTAALPIRVEKTNDDELTTEIYTVDPAGVTEGSDNDLPTGSDGETQEDYLTWTRYAYDADTAMLSSVDRYHDVPANGTGTLTTNFHRTVYRYDDENAGYNGAPGRRTHVIEVVSGTATASGAEQVTETTYDVLGRVVSVERGVSGAAHDMGSDYSTYPTLKKVSESFYDEATPGSGTPGVGDGLVTSTLAYYDAANIDADHAVETIYHYNGRGQLRGVQPEAGPFMVQDVDNLGRVVAGAQFAAAPTWATVLSDDDYAENANDTNRRSLSTTAFDEMGRAYRAEVYAVTSAGAKGDRVRTDNYYDRNGALVATATTGRGGTEFAYDAAGRRCEVRAVAALQSTKYQDGAYQYCDPQPGASADGNEGVYEIVRTTYDSVGNVTQTVTMEMNHGDTTNLGISLTANDFVRTFTYHWYEPVTHRLKTTAYYGSGHDTWYYAATPPAYEAYVNRPTASGSSCLVTAFTYDAAGRLETVTDPTGAVTKTTYDALGRKVYVAENWTNFLASDESGTGGGTYGDQDRVTRFAYDGLSQLTTQTALDPDADGDQDDNQATVYTYGDAYNASLVTKIKYPDGDDTDDNVAFAYDLDGRMATRTAQELSGQGSRPVITFDYDATYRRLVKQCVTTPAGVDEAVLAIGTSFDDVGRVEKITSYSDADGTEVLDQIQYAYNDLGALDKEYQNHDGAVAVETTPYVQYAYDDTDSNADDVFDKAMRLKSVRYPDTRTVHYLYADAGDQAGLGDAVSRLTAVASASTRGQDDANVYASYAYNGVGRVVSVAHPKVTSGLRLTYQVGSTSGMYTGFDRFGRVRWQRWTNDAGAWKSVVFYGYDYAGNPVYRCVRQSNLGVGPFGEAYAYDGLHRLVKAQRGILNGGAGGDLRAPIGGDTDNDGVIDIDDVDAIDNSYTFGGGDTWEEGDFNGDGTVDVNDYDIIDTNWTSTPTRTPTRTWAWTLDAVGNWSEFKADAGDGTTWDLDQDRLHNAVNEIDNDNDHSNAPNASIVGGSWVLPRHDAAGNMIVAPRPGDEATADEALVLVYDAWNRLVAVYKDEGDTSGARDSGDTLVATYRYDGLNRRIRKTLGAAEGLMPESLLGYTETDPNTHLTVTASEVAADDLARTEDARVYLDLMADLTAEEVGTASSNSVLNATYAASKAFDGTLNTAWCSVQYETTNRYLQFDFGPNRAPVITSYRMYPWTGNYTYAPKTWYFQGSSDGVNWSDPPLHAQSSDFTSWTAQYETFDFANTTGYRYYRLVVTSVNGGSYIMLSELDLGVSPEATSDSEFSATYAAGKAFDNSTSSYWCTKQYEVSDVYLQYDFGPGISRPVSRYRITRMTSQTRTPKTWVFKGSHDGVNWEDDLDTQTNVTDWSSSTREFPFDNAVAYRYYRLEIAAANDAQYIYVAELDLGRQDVGLGFVHAFDVTFQGGSSGRAVVWAVSNEVDDAYAWDDVTPAQAVSATLVGGATAQLVLKNHETGTSDSCSGLAVDTTYYATVERTAADTVELRLYSDAGRTTLVDTLVVDDVNSARTWRYLFAANSYNDGQGTSPIDFTVAYAGTTPETHDFYYNASWQVVEERRDGAATPYAQYVWDARYIDALVCRDRDTSNGAAGGPDGDCADADDERLYACQDANFNVLALVATDGNVVERYAYDPYGRVTVLHGADDADGAVDEWDEDTSGPDWDNAVLYCGYRFDAETGLYHVRNRVYHPTFGRWVQRDPLGYVDGMGLYEYASSMALRARDPSGLLILLIHGKTAASHHFGRGEMRDIRTQIAERTKELAGRSPGTEMKVRSPEDDVWTEVRAVAERNRSAGAGDREPIIIVGYSDGATEAKRLCEKLFKQYPNEKVNYVGIIDMARKTRDSLPSTSDHVTLHSNQIQDGDNFYQRHTPLIQGMKVKDSLTIQNHRMRTAKATGESEDRAGHFNIITDQRVQETISENASQAWADAVE
jgi:RHS repeat-associated protein